MLLVQRRAPAGVIDHQIEEEPRPFGMNGVGQLAELLGTRGAAIELDQRRINCRQIEARVGTAEPAKPRVSRRRRVDRQQMEDPAAERVDDVRQFPNHVAQLARGWNRRVPFLIQLLQLPIQLLVRGGSGSFGLTE